MSNNRNGLSKREFAAQQAGQPMPYATKSQITKQAYSASNISNAAANPTGRPDLNSYGINSLSDSVNKYTKSANDYALQTKKSLAKIKDTKSNPVALPVQGLQASNYANQRDIEGSSITAGLQEANTALNNARALYATDLGQYNADRSYDLQMKQFNASQAKANKPEAVDVLAGAAGSLQRGEGGFVDYAKYQQAKQNAITTGKISPDQFDSQYAWMLSPQDNQKFISAQGGATPAVVSSWTSQIQSGQAKLTDIPASQSDLRNQVQVALAQSGTSAEGKPTTTEMGMEALRTANDLKSMVENGNGTSAVGKSRVFGLQLIPGTSPYNLQVKFQSLKDKLSLDAVKYLKGQGQISDAERALLASAVTELNLGQSEEQFKTTLNTIINKLSGGQVNDPMGIR
jgi:hypothetical protein